MSSSIERRAPAPGSATWLVTVLALALSYAACSGGPAPAPSSATASAPVSGGVLTYLELQPHTNLYPPAGGLYPNGGILNQITDRLTYQDPQTLAIEPWIAESWAINADATEYTFTLRQGVTFSDGTPVDAAAVAKNFDTYGLGNDELTLPRSEVINGYRDSQVIDARTVRFRFHTPAPGFLQGTSVIGSGLVSPGTLARSLEQLGDATLIIGSGPFVVTSEVPGRQLTLTARADYAWAPPSLTHQGRPRLDGVQFVVTPEDSVRVGALLAGQASVIRQVQAYDEQRVTDSGFRVFAPPTRGVNNSVAFRPDNPLVADVRVRRALQLATDASQVVETLFSARYPLARSVLAATAPGYVDLSAQLTHDIGAAQRLLDDAGWLVGADGIRQKDGRRLVLAAHESPPQPQSKATLQLLAQQWRRVGVVLDILTGDLGSRTVANLDPEKTPLAVAMVGRADPDVLKSNYYPSNRNVLLQKDGTSPLVRHFKDDRLNALLEAIAAEPNPSKRLALSGDTQRYLLDQAYVIPLFEEPQAYAAAPNVHDLAFESVGRPSFYRAWLSP